MIRSLFVSTMLLGSMLLTASAFAQTHKVAPDKVPNYWDMTKSEVDGNVPNVGHKLDAPGCVAVSYMIGSDGIPRHLKARKVVPADSAFGLIAVSLVRNFRYAPSSDNDAGVPISTYYVVRFNMPKDPAAKAALLKRCALPGFGS